MHMETRHCVSTEHIPGWDQFGAMHKNSLAYKGAKSVLLS